ncbi:hypothetical protein N9M74_01005 [Pontimonas sp.]|nr:hypothetical protein [Pontimonas sp.]
MRQRRLMPFASAITGEDEKLTGSAGFAHNSDNRCAGHLPAGFLFSKKHCKIETKYWACSPEDVMKKFFDKRPYAFRYTKYRRKIQIGLTVALIGAGAAGSVYAAQISVPVIELTASVAAQPNCFEDSVVDVQSQFASDAVSDSDLYVSQISITGVSTSCDGNYARLQLLDSGATVLQEIVWLVESAVGVTSITLISDGSTTSSSNTTTGTTRTNYPTSQTDPNGLAMDETAPTSISEFRLTASVDALSETT